MIAQIHADCTADRYIQRFYLPLQVYQKVHGAGTGVIPSSALALSHPASLRAAEAESKEPDKTERVRQTSDLMWRLGNYKTITCDCGTKLRIPPKFKEPAVRCPHCGRSNPVA